MKLFGVGYHIVGMDTNVRAPSAKTRILWSRGLRNERSYANVRECIRDVGARLVRRMRLCKILDSGKESCTTEAKVNTGIEGSSKRSAIAYLFVRAILGARGAAERQVSQIYP